MPRMIDLMRQSAVPANVMRSASKGALALPAAEMIEILVYLASTPLFGEDARLTLASWDEAACRAVCSDPASPNDVLEYFLHNRRPRLMPALLDNPAIPESALLEIAQEQSAESVQLLLATARAKASANVLQALASNPVLMPSQVQQVREALERTATTEQAAELTEDAEYEEAVAQYVAEHAAEIAAEEGKGFQLVGDAEAEPQAVEPVPGATVPSAAVPAAAALAVKKAAKREDDERISPLQKISRLTVGERVQLAIKGKKEERFILIRDGSKVVSSAVLESPKINDQEVEMFASMKNVQESVLRGIAGKRKFMKTYAIVRALANNPRCPLDVQLTIIKNLLNMDLRTLTMNKNISETVRKVALKMFHERTEKKSSFG
ncbi:MAG: hypothetical protein LAN70_14235 [Acidobacteriia bacterium]|nr:hypothetical protein [Terriglobia bacterium]